jgi:hypothetical protein
MQIKKWLLIAGAFYLIGMTVIFFNLSKQHKVRFKPRLQVGTNDLTNPSKNEAKDWKTEFNAVMDRLKYWKYVPEIKCIKILI